MNGGINLAAGRLRTGLTNQGQVDPLADFGGGSVESSDSRRDQPDVFP